MTWHHVVFFRQRTTRSPHERILEHIVPKKSRTEDKPRRLLRKRFLMALHQQLHWRRRPSLGFRSCIADTPTVRHRRIGQSGFALANLEFHDVKWDTVRVRMPSKTSQPLRPLLKPACEWPVSALLRKGRRGACRGRQQQRVLRTGGNRSQYPRIDRKRRQPTMEET